MTLFTEAPLGFAGATIPILLGGHTLVGPGLRVLLGSGSAPR